MRLAAALLAVLLLTGCRSSYDGPSFAGEWITPPRSDGRVMTLVLTQDLGAFFHEPVHGELTDVEGHTWHLAGAPERQKVGGVVTGAPIKVGLREPLCLLTDQGQVRVHESGPLPWTLVRGALEDGAEAITLHLGRGGPLWAEPDPATWAHCTFRRAGAAGPTTSPAVTPPPLPEGACASCGAALEAAWRHCPMCGLSR